MIPKTRKEAFEVLGLSENASEQEIKKAYKKFALKWHLDKWSDKSQEEQKTATKKCKEIIVAYKILTGEIDKKCTSQQFNDDQYSDEEVERFYKEFCKETHRELGKRLYSSHLSEEELDLFDALFRKNLTKTKTLLKTVQNINAQEKFVSGHTSSSILHYLVSNSCNDPESGWIKLLEEVLSKYSASNSTSAIDVNIMNGYRKTPLCVACEQGNLDVVNLLLEYRANPNIHDTSHIPLHYALKENKIDIAKVLLEHRAKAEELGYHTILKYNKSAVEVLLPCLSDETKKLMLCSIAMNSSVETDHDIELVTLLLKAGTNANCFIQYADPKKKGKLVKLCNEYKKNAINNNHIYNSEIRWAVIVPELLFGAIGATLAAMGIIPEIAAIGMIATVVLSGIVGAIVGGVAGYLVDVAIDQCRSNAQAANA